jgi:uncharacterized repeat protein (TIGR01451 family)
VEPRQLLSTITVVNAADSGAGSLRQAILDANSGDTIAFGIPGSGVHEIQLASPLPTIGVPLTIDGYSQLGSNPNTLTDGDDATLLIEVDGFGMSGFLDPAGGLITIASSGVTVRGLALSGVMLNANDSLHTIVVSGPGGDLIEGNFLGTNATGTSLPAWANTSDGILIDGAPGNTIGGVTPAARNVISGNSARFDPRLFPAGYNDIGAVDIKGGSATDIVVEGNYIGTDRTGTAALGNLVGVQIDGAPGTTIGGSAAGARNVISGNGTGISVTGAAATGTAVLGNFIGTDFSGQSTLANHRGIEIESSNNTIGGTATADRNVLQGVRFFGAHATGNLLEGNYIGTDSTGSRAMSVKSQPGESSIFFGVEIIAGSSNTIGGVVAGARNIIAGGGDSDGGVFITDNQGAGLPLGVAANNLVEGNYIGVDVTGSQALVATGATALNGIEDEEGTGNTIGGTTAAARNVISGNADGIDLLVTSGELVEGNYIGTDASGTTAIGNTQNGIRDGGKADTIGGMSAAARNIISGNGYGNGAFGAGVYVTGTDGVVEGNFIGTDVTGTSGLGNSHHGVLVETSDSYTVGGTAAGAANVIAFNGTASGDDGIDSFVQAVNPNLTNSIFANHGLGIRIVNYVTGTNDTQDAPILTLADTKNGVTTFQGTVSGKELFNPGNRNARIEFFANPVPAPGELEQGKVYLGFTNVSLDENGNATFDVQIPDPTGAGPDFTATATPDGGVTSEFSQGIHGTITGVPSADLTLSGSAPAGPLTVGDRLTYSLTVVNKGPDQALGVILTDTLPPGLKLVSADPAPTTQNGSALTFDLGDLESAGKITVRIIASATETGTQSNTATVAGNPNGPLDPDASNNTFTASTLVNPTTEAAPDIAVSIAIPPDPVYLGRQLVYTLTIVNHGSGPATGVVLNDALPSGATPVSVASSQGSVSPSTGSVAAWLGTLAPGAKATVTIVVALGGSPNQLIDTASVSSTETDSDPSNNTTSLTTLVASGPAPAPGPLPGALPDGPMLVEIDRTGYHRFPTTLVLRFDAALDPTTAQNVHNYVLTGPNSTNRVIPISWARYDSKTRSVTLRPSHLLNFHNWFNYQLTVRGSATSGVTDLAGRLLDGNRDGLAGGDAVVRFHGYGKVFPKATAAATVQTVHLPPRTLTPARRK